MEKAPGKDGQGWKYMPKSVGEALWKLMNKIWKKGRIPGLEERYNMPHL